MANLLYPEAFIIDNLATIPDLKKVFSVMNIEDFKMKSEISPAAACFYNGYEVLEEKLSMVYRVELSFVVLLAIKTSFDVGVIRTNAGEILHKIIIALIGKRPSSDFSPLRLDNTYRPIVVPGFGFFPLTFRTTTVLGDL